MADETARREEERRRVALAEHPGGEYLGGGLVRLPDGRVARSSVAASNHELRRANVLANDAAVKALLSQGRSLASLVGDDGVLDDTCPRSGAARTSMPWRRWPPSCGGRSWPARRRDGQGRRV